MKNPNCKLPPTAHGAAIHLSRLLALTLFLCASACTTKAKPVWIYTSIYKEVIDELRPALHAEFPDLDIQWFQGGSENIASKVGAEMLAGKPKADLVLTSDPFWYVELKQKGLLLAYQSPLSSKLSPQFTDPQNMFSPCRLPVMVIGYNSKLLAAKDLPKSWKDLLAPQWKGKLAMPSPLESGTAFTFVALLSKNQGWDFFKDLRQQEILAAGGNAAVMNRIETGERPLGILLLENILKAQSKGSPIRPIYPSDGAVPINSPIAILKATEHPEEAKKIYDWFLSRAAQIAIIKSGMYSPDPAIDSPPGAMSYTQIQKQMLPWSEAIAEELYSRRDDIKSQFSTLVLR